MAQNSGKFVVSLDLELMWGVRNFLDRDDYGAVILKGRETTPRLLDRFAEHNVAATWATVGFIFCESKEELISILPDEDLRPNFTNKRDSNYNYLDEIGKSELDDPYYLGASLVKQIAATPKQEIATHTLSHYFCLEEGSTLEAFRADLKAAHKIAARRGIELKSIVFPRNQYSDAHLEVCKQENLQAYRGNQANWAYHAFSGMKPSLTKRALRLIDAHGPILGHKFSAIGDQDMKNVSASMYLRPTQTKFSSFHSQHIRAIKSGMTQAAKTGNCFHLWWHPHDFGVNTEENLQALDHILAHYTMLADRYDMQARTMADFSDAA